MKTLKESLYKINEADSSNINKFIKFWDKLSHNGKKQFIYNMKELDKERYNLLKSKLKNTSIDDLASNNFEAMPEVAQDILVAYFSFSLEY